MLVGIVTCLVGYVSYQPLKCRTCWLVGCLDLSGVLPMAFSLMEGVDRKVSWRSCLQFLSNRGKQLSRL